MAAQHPEYSTLYTASASVLVIVYLFGRYVRSGVWRGPALLVLLAVGAAVHAPTTGAYSYGWRPRGNPTLEQLNPLSGRLGGSSSDGPPTAAELARTDLPLIGHFQRVDQHALTNAHAAHERECLGAPRQHT